MSQIAQYLTPEDLKQITNLQVLARLVVEGFCSGLHRSPHKGFSVEFKQHRPYVHGDEIRRLDWRLFGKTDRFFIREYEEETNLRATLLLDQSGSMGYAGAEGRDASKLQYATRIAACLSYLMLQQQDSVGMVTFDHKIRRYIPPRSRPGHLRVLINDMDRARPGGETELGKVFHDLVPKIHRRGLLIVLSDCFGDVPQLLSSLAHFRHARHEVVIFQIWHRDELEFPFRHWTRFESMETAGHDRLVDPALLRAAYMANLASFRDQLRQGCHRHHVDLVPMVTDEPYAFALAQYLALRRKLA